MPITQWWEVMIMFWQRKDNRVRDHVVLLTPVKMKVTGSWFPGWQKAQEKKKKKGKNPTNPRAHLQYGDPWRHEYTMLPTSAWKFQRNLRSGTRKPLFPYLLLLPLDDQAIVWLFLIWILHFRMQPLSLNRRPRQDVAAENFYRSLTHIRTEYKFWVNWR